ncbi:hypothetical protein NDU88_001838 [Pleurodeles waltl]|uniref:Uncharacterized protein n=1 Tax=Pleurodeles waltl TaxID=8319 RepID=A0AAV7P4Z6_PLEWA|nr:hypothetical protein NDU88_001838 [Pleurodeles waltl]
MCVMRRRVLRCSARTHPHPLPQPAAFQDDDGAIQGDFVNRSEALVLIECCFFGLLIHTSVLEGGLAQRCCWLQRSPWAAGVPALPGESTCASCIGHQSPHPALPAATGARKCACISCIGTCAPCSASRYRHQ